MTQPRFAIVAIAIAVVALGLLAPAPDAAAAARGTTDPTVVTAQLSATGVVVGTEVSVSGTVAVAGLGIAWPLTLELRTATGWQQVGSASADDSGSYSMPVPTDWYGRHVLRIVAAAAGVVERGVSENRSVTVTPGYAPRGSATSWKSFDRRPRWNPCTTIPFLTNLARAPRGSKALVRRAFAIVHAATGLRFHYAGSSTRVPWSTLPQSRQFPARGLVIAWTTPRTVPRLKGSTAGVGGSWSRSTDGGPYEYFKGGVAIDATQRLGGAGFGDGQSVGALLLHEIGHTMGLDHTGARSQLMYPSLQDTFKGRYEAGDLAGLHALGAAQGCF